MNLFYVLMDESHERFFSGYDGLGCYYATHITRAKQYELLEWARRDQQDGLADEYPHIIRVNCAMEDIT